MTFRMRPSVAGPTGMVIGPPVSTTSLPRTMPSVLSMAMQRTVRSPSSCATSSTRVASPLRAFSAFWMKGSSPSNWTSTTAPSTCVTCPTLFFAMWECSSFSDRFGAGDDLDQLPRDVRLARAVIVQGQPVDHLTGVTGGVVHRRHARTLLAGGAFDQRAEQLDRHVPGQQGREDGLLVG